jgi:hypothetical protein
VSTRLSPDGMFYWDGQQWLTTLSADGRTRWNGTAWIPASQLTGPLAHQQLSRPMREATSWTRPLQYTVAGFYALQTLYSLSLPFWMGGPMGRAMTQSINESMQRQQQLNPAVSPPPAALTDAMNSMMTSVLVVGLWLAAVFGVVIGVVAIIGALKRWTWTYYVVLVLLGFSALALPANLLSFVSGSARSAMGGVSMPSWAYELAIAVGIPAAALFVWMLVALVKWGPWAMRRVDSPLS